MAAAVSTALDFGLISAAKEFSAAVKTLNDAAEKAPHNQLIQAIVNANKDEQQASSSSEGFSVDLVIERVRQARSIVEAKAPAEAAEYKQMVLEVADRVANASGEGFFGTGKKVSDKEAEYLGKLRDALGL
ncbi:hypothetical protein KEG38_54560 [Polyangium jinanense]|nr:hypothetical protein [Polyangium jinanense]